MSVGQSFPQQAAAIPFRRLGDTVQVCLIRKKGSKSWGIPKGLVEPGDTQEGTALQEVWEEAGLRGRLIGECVGTYEYEKWGTRFTVSVFLMEVSHEQERWQETDFRERRWISLDEATALLIGHPARFLLDRARNLLGDSASPGPG